MSYYTIVQKEKVLLELTDGQKIFHLKQPTLRNKCQPWWDTRPEVTIMAKQKSRNKQEKLKNAVESVPGDNLNQNHNVKKEALVPNTKR